MYHKGVQIGEVKNTDMTKKQIKALAKRLEDVTGIKCINVNQLRHNAPLKMWQDAWKKDRNWFRGLADTIYENT